MTSQRGLAARPSAELALLIQQLIVVQCELEMGREREQSFFQESTNRLNGDTSHRLLLLQSLKLRC